jgi:hypothetical protein
MFLSADRVESFGGGDACRFAAALAALIPLDEVSSFGKCFPIVVVGFFATWNRNHFPATVDLEAFESALIEWSRG